MYTHLLLLFRYADTFQAVCSLFNATRGSHLNRGISLLEQIQNFTFLAHSYAKEQINMSRVFLRAAAHRGIIGVCGSCDASIYTRRDKSRDRRTRKINTLP